VHKPLLNNAPEIPVGSCAPIDSSCPRESSLTGLLVRGTSWNVIGAMFQKATTMCAGIVVARLLSPQDYAVAGLAITIMGIFNTVMAHGFGLALVQRKELTGITIHSIFWFLAVVGVGLGGLVVIVVAPWAARSYDQPALAPVIRVLGLGLAIGMIGSVPNSLMQRAMRFREINAIGMVGSVAATVLGIGFAWLGYGYWALILPSVGSNLLKALFAFRFSRYSPVRAFKWRELTDNSNLGFSIAGSNLARYFAEYSDSMIMGYSWSPADLGQYYFALGRSRQLFNLVMQQLGNVIFPTFSRIQDDLPRLRRAYLQGTRAIVLIIYPVHVLLIGLADLWIPWVFGEQWRPSVPVLQVLAAYSFVNALRSLAWQALLAIDRPRGIVVFQIVRMALVLPTLLVLGSNGVDTLTTAVVMLVIWTVLEPFYLAHLYNLLHIRWVESWYSLRQLISATAVMALALVAIRIVAAMAGWPALLTVVVITILPSTIYVWLARRPINEMLQQVRLALRRGT